MGPTPTLGANLWRCTFLSFNVWQKGFLFWFVPNIIQNEKTEILGIVDQIEGTASSYMASILQLWDQLKQVQTLLDVPQTDLFSVRSLIGDNASVNKGIIGGLITLLNIERKADFDKQVRSDTFENAVFIGCGDHIAALVLKNFSVEVVKFSQKNSEFKFLAHAKKCGGWIATPFHVLKQISRRLLGVLRPEWQAARFLTGGTRGKHASTIIP